MRSITCSVRLFLGLACLLWMALGQPALAQDIGWPREYRSDGYRVIVYQPQIDAWDGYTTMKFLCAVEIAPSKAGKSVYGVLAAQAATQVNVSTRVVTLSNLKITELRFPQAAAQDQQRYTAIVKSALPSAEGKTTDISLDRVLAYMETPPAAQRAVSVNLDPPPIYYSSRPAILLIFMGKPEFRPVPGTGLMAATNTNWDLFLDPVASRYYLLDGESWLTTEDPLKGPWQAAGPLPTDFGKLPDDDNWRDVRKNVPGKPARQVPHVFATTQPAELIVTRGEPTFTPIPGTKLLVVANTDSALFLHPTQQRYYFQVAGRWFRAKSLNGPWEAASTSLPEDFSRIPGDSELAAIKATVPGTEEARDAVLLASVPQKTTINRSEARAQVRYDGEPSFVAIKGTSVKYAVNTPNDVFLVDGAYYCLYQGIWFTASGPKGPWAVATSVPQAIYAIPANSPKHNVTYVYVYSSTPTTVQVGYTAGYNGEYVAANGVLMFGFGLLAGAALADYHDCYCAYSYGGGVVYNYGYGGYYRGGAVYGPYGGAGAAGYYNPSTGAWARGAYRYGPAGSVAVREGYNPFTDTYGARATVRTPYGSSGRFYAERGNQAVWGGHETGPRSTVGWARGSEGGSIIHGSGIAGQGTLAKDKEGNLYVGKDGNVYKRGTDGSWSKFDNGGWQPVSGRQTGATPSARATSGARTRPGETGAAPAPGSRTGAREQRPGGAREGRPALPESGTEGTRGRRAAPAEFGGERAAGERVRPTPSGGASGEGAGGGGGWQQRLDRDAFARARGDRNAAFAGSAGGRLRSGGGGLRRR